MTSVNAAPGQIRMQATYSESLTFHSERRVFATNISWAVAGNFSSSLLQWLNLVIIAKLGNSLALGRYAFTLACVAPVVILSALQLRSVQATDARNQFSVGDFFTLRCITGACALLIICGMALADHHAEASASLLILIGTARSIDGLSDVFYGSLQKYSRLDLVARSLLIKGVANCASLGAAMYYFRSLPLGAFAMVLISACMVILHDSAAARRVAAQHGVAFRGRDLVTLARVKQLFRLTYPLGVAGGINAFRGNISRYVVAYALGVRAVGVFSALAYANTGILTAAAAIGQAISPRFGIYAAGARRAEFNRIVLRVIAIAASSGLVIWLGCSLFAREILTLAYNAELGSLYRVFRCVLAALPFAVAASFLNDAMVARRSMSQQVLLFVSVALVEGLTASVLVWRYRLTGVAIAVVAAASVQAAIAAYYVFKEFDAVRQ